MQTEQVPALTSGTIVRFLGFQSSAIRAVAGSRRATWVGLLFVVSAGFAREYDGEFLVAEPWHVGIPLVASLVGCGILTCLVWLLAWRRQVQEVSFGGTFRALLNLYWMTAPLAWVYAIPVERLLSPTAATVANLGLLAIVATWRVALMVRCVGVLYGASVISAAAPVLLFSTVIAWIALRLVPSPVFMIMGGVRLTESEEIILSTRLLIEASCVLTAPVWLLCYLVLLWSREGWRWTLAEQQQTPAVASRGLWGWVAMSLLVWLPVLPFTQAEQGWRWKLETLLRAGQYADVCQLARQCQRDDLPPHWDAPPRIGYGEERPELLPTLVGLYTHDPPSWLWQIYEDKLVAQLGYYGPMSSQNGHQFSRLRDDEVVALVALLQESGQGRGFARAMMRVLEEELRGQGDVQISPQRRAAVEQLMQFVESK